MNYVYIIIHKLYNKSMLQPSDEDKPTEIIINVTDDTNPAPVPEAVSKAVTVVAVPAPDKVATTKTETGDKPSFFSKVKKFFSDIAVPELEPLPKNYVTTKSTLGYEDLFTKLRVKWASHTGYLLKDVGEIVRITGTNQYRLEVFIRTESGERKIRHVPVVLRVVTRGNMFNAHHTYHGFAEVLF